MFASKNPKTEEKGGESTVNCLIRDDPKLKHAATTISVMFKYDFVDNNEYRDCVISFANPEHIKTSY